MAGPHSLSLGRRLLIPALVAGALLRAWALPTPGSPDVGSWKIWTFVGATDATGLYGVGGSPPERRLLKWRGMEGTTEYPPLALYELAAVGRIYRAIDPRYDDTPTLNVLVKLPGLLTELLFVGVLLTWGRRRLGEPAAWMAIAFWLNPAVLINGAGLGYLDAQMAVPAGLALLAAALGAPFLAGALAVAAVLTKAQALFVLPAIALVVWHRQPERRGRVLLETLAGAALAASLIVGPIILRGAWANMLQALARLAAHNMVSGNMLNVWWIVTWIVRVQAATDMDLWSALTMKVRILKISDFTRLYPNPKPLGTLLVVAAVGWGLWRARRSASLAGASLLAAWCVFAYAMLGIQVHENHVYLAVPFVVIAAGLDRSLRPLCWTVSTLVALNMYLFYGVGNGQPLLIDRSWTIIDASLVLAFINVGVFVWCTKRLVAALKGRPTPDPSRARTPSS